MYARRSRFLPRLLLILLALLIPAMVGTVAAKYIFAQESEVTVTFTAELADSMELWEHQAQKSAEGVYKLTDTKITSGGGKGNSYAVVIPGLDIPKNPTITITQKSPVKAYLFLEVVGYGPDDDTTGVSYDLETHWVQLDSVTGNHGGTVYVYGAGTNPIQIPADNSTVAESMNFGIILNDTVYVSECRNMSANSLNINFYACMGEAAIGTPAETYLVASNPPTNG